MAELLRLFQKEQKIPTVPEQFTLHEQFVLHYFDAVRGDIVTSAWVVMNKARLRTGQPLLEVQEYEDAVASLQQRGLIDLDLTDLSMIRVAEITGRGRKAARAIRGNEEAFRNTVTVQLPISIPGNSHA